MAGRGVQGPYRLELRTIACLSPLSLVNTESWLLGRYLGAYIHKLDYAGIVHSLIITCPVLGWRVMGCRDPIRWTLSRFALSEVWSYVFV